MPDAEIERAKVLIAAASYDEAEQTLLSVRSREALKVEVPFLLGMIALARNAPRSAIESFRQAIVHEPNSIRLRLALARAFYLDGAYEDAFRQFQRARAAIRPSRWMAATMPSRFDRMDKAGVQRRLSLATTATQQRDSQRRRKSSGSVRLTERREKRRRCGGRGWHQLSRSPSSARLRFGTQVSDASIGRRFRLHDRCLHRGRGWSRAVGSQPARRFRPGKAGSASRCRRRRAEVAY